MSKGQSRTIRSAIRVGTTSRSIKNMLKSTNRPRRIHLGQHVTRHRPPLVTIKDKLELWTKVGEKGLVMQLAAGPSLQGGAL
jgi:hypothetical protein